MKVVLFLWEYKKLHLHMHREIVWNFSSQECQDKVCVQLDTVGNIRCLLLLHPVCLSSSEIQRENKHFKRGTSLPQ